MILSMRSCSRINTSKGGAVKIKPYEETHMEGAVSFENNPWDENAHIPVIYGDFGIEIAEDGRVWICIDGISFIRFTPKSRYTTVGSKLSPGG